MRKLVIAAAVSMSLATISVNTHALSLGEIEMYSALNQTLDAEINIVSFAPGELDGMSVGLAPAEAFAAAGLQRSRVLADMRFDVERRPDGVPVVKVTSNGPIIEPFLSFLLQIDSPQGSSLIREYTVLLDPPVFVAQQNELIIAAPAVIETTENLSNVGVSTAINRDTDLQDGVSLDLASELGDDVPAVTFNEQSTDSQDAAALDSASMVVSEQVLEDTDALGAIVDTTELLNSAEFVQNLDNSIQVGVSDNVAVADDAGELLDLAAELIDQTPELVDNSDGIDVQLDSVAGGGNAIFDSDAPTDFAETDENIVSLDSLLDETVTDETMAVADPVASLTSVIDRATVTGETVSLDGITTDNSVGSSAAISGTVAAIDGSEVVDLNSSVFEPEVTLEQVESTMVPANPVDDNSAEAFVTAAMGDVLGEAIDISGIVPGDDSDFSDVVATTSTATTFSSDTYRVRANDTLWSIAQSQKASGVSTPQMVSAILDANQDAFINGDMNRLRDGAELRIPADLGSVNNAAATAVVMQEPTMVAPAESGQVLETVMTEELAPVQETLTIVGVDENASGDGMASTSELTGTSDLDRDLDAVNKKMMLAQEELTSESLQRDELSSRVVELEESLANMKKLITLRESELGNLQTELQTAEVDSETESMAMEAEEKARELEISQAEKDEMQKDLQRLQDNITADASMAQERIDAQADADKNLASAEAEAKSVRLASEEDALKLQLAQLQVEKAELIESAQNDKLALLQQSEAEKAQLLANAKAEQERIKATLEAEKTRITEAASAESARVEEEARVEKEKLLAEANAERERLAAESEAMRTRLEALELEKDRLLAESEADKAQLAETTKKAVEDQSRLQAEAEAEKLRFEEESTKVKDRLAALQAEASANLSDADQSTDVVSNVMDKTAEAGSDATGTVKDLAGKGAAAAGGLLAIAPLQKELGARKNVLAAGGGLALLGLLGAWAMRRRSPAVVKSDRDIPVDIDTSDDIGQPSRAQFDDRGGNYEEVDEPRSTMGRAAVAASAAAAATGAAVSRDASADERYEQPASAPVDDIPVVHDRVEAEPDPAHQLVDNSLLDDTITEADVYLRYGLHGQAEDLLQTAIERAPDNEDYHLKLLENYHDQKNADGFKTAAANYRGRFQTSSHWERISEMGRSIDPREGLYSRDGNGDSGIGGAAMVTGAAAAAAAANAISGNTGNLDETIDAGAEFNVDDLAATGDFSRADDTFGLDDLDDISLDEVDLAALDDDGTLNLEEVAGNEMSGLDLGSLDLTNPDGDSTLDNLTLDDADLNSLGDVTSNVRSGLESDLDISDNYSADSNEMETMLDLAKAYIDMGDSDSAANALRDIVGNGNAAQQKEAADLLKNLT